MNFESGSSHWSRLSNVGASQRTCSGPTKEVARLHTLAIVPEAPPYSETGVLLDNCWKQSFPPRISCW